MMQSAESVATRPNGGLPLLPCTKFNFDLVWAVCGSGQNLGKEYYKCPNNTGIVLSFVCAERQGLSMGENSGGVGAILREVNNSIGDMAEAIDQINQVMAGLNQGASKAVLVPTHNTNAILREMNNSIGHMAEAIDQINQVTVGLNRGEGCACTNSQIPMPL